METIINDLNPMLKGWFNYFKHAHEWTFPKIDRFIRRPLRSLRHKQRTGHSGFGRSKHLSQLMPNAYFANYGLFTMKEAHRLAWENRMHGSEGGEGREALLYPYQKPRMTSSNHILVAWVPVVHMV